MSAALRQFLTQRVPRLALAFDADWNESKVKRADNGQFGSGGGKSTAESTPEKPGATTLNFAKGKDHDAGLHGIPLSSWKPPADWHDVEGQNPHLAEPPLPQGKNSSGIVMLEPDGRVWLIKPSKGFGGYKHTFPKGGIEHGLDPQANAIKETYEESGLKGRVLDHLGDYEGDTSTTRYYVGRRTGGDPSDHGDESEQVVLVPLTEAKSLLNRSRDRRVIDDLIARIGGAKKPAQDAAFRPPGMRGHACPRISTQDSAREALRSFMVRRYGLLEIAADHDFVPRCGWRSPSWLAMDADDDLWSEESHPRAPDGKFAKKGQGHVSPKLTKMLTEAGFAHHGDYPGSEIYKHPSGHEVAFHHPYVSQGKLKLSTAFQHLPPPSQGGASKITWGGKALQELIDKVNAGSGSAAEKASVAQEYAELFGTTGAAEPATAAAAKNEVDDLYAQINANVAALPQAEPSASSIDGDAAEQKKLIEEHINGMPQSGQEVAAQLTGLGYKPEAHWLGIDYMKDDHGVGLYNDGSFAILDKGGKPLGGGKAGSDVAAELYQVTGKTLGGKASAASAPTTTAPFPKAVTPPAGFSLEDKGGTMAVYGGPNGVDLDVYDNGSWDLYKGGPSGTTLAKGDTQGELDAAIAKHITGVPATTTAAGTASGSAGYVSPPLDVPLNIASSHQSPGGPWTGMLGDGTGLSIYPDNSWVLEPGGKPPVSGNGQSELDSAIGKHIAPNANFGAATATAPSATHHPVAFPDSDVPVAAPLEFKPEYSGSDVATYTGTGETGLAIHEDGSWTVTDMSNDDMLGEGQGQHQLDTVLFDLGYAGPPAAPVGATHHPVPFPYGNLQAPMAFPSLKDDGPGVKVYNDPDKANSPTLHIGSSGWWMLQSANGESIAEGGTQQEMDDAVAAEMGGASTTTPAPAATAPATPAATHHPAPYGKLQAPVGFGAASGISSGGKTYGKTGAAANGEPHLFLTKTGGWQIKEPGGGVLSKGITQNTLDKAAQKYLPNAFAPPPGSAPATPPATPTAPAMAGVAAAAAPAKKLGSVGAPLDESSLTKIGEKKGSNPGGTYQDKDGNKFYVKQTKSADHARNELLAARLYQLAGAPTLDYHPMGDKGVATQWQELNADNVLDLSDAQRAQARLDFATHAWTANWDAAGLANDNIGADKDGNHVNLDVGGALAYRAQGEPKGSKFGNDVGEWDSLRDPSTNKTSAALFKDLTKEEIAVSSARIAQVSAEQINQAIQDAGYSGAEAAGLFNKLVERRVDVLKRAKAEFAQLANPAAPATPGAPPPSGNVASPKHTSHPEWNQTYHARLKAAPQPNQKEAAALYSYTGSDYDAWNTQLRDSLGQDPGQFAARTKDLDAYMERASFPENAEVRRRVSKEYAKYLVEEAESAMDGGEPFAFDDQGFISTDKWSGTLTLNISVPQGARAAAVGQYSANPGEAEIMLARGSRFVMDSFDANTMTMHVRMVRSGKGKGAILHNKKPAP